MENYSTESPKMSSEELDKKETGSQVITFYSNVDSELEDHFAKALQKCNQSEPKPVTEPPAVTGGSTASLYQAEGNQAPLSATPANRTPYGYADLLQSPLTPSSSLIEKGNQVFVYPPPPPPTSQPSPGPGVTPFSSPACLPYQQHSVHQIYSKITQPQYIQQLHGEADKYHLCTDDLPEVPGEDRSTSEIQVCSPTNKDAGNTFNQANYPVSQGW